MVEEVAKHSVVHGYEIIECIYKRFYWCDNGCFFTYESSVPDETTDEKAEDLVAEKGRYDILHRTTCFKQLDNTQDLLFEQIFQVGFGEVHSKTLLE